MFNAWHLTHANASIILTTFPIMVNKFQLKKLFTREELTKLVQNYGFKRMSIEEIEVLLQNAFFDYVLVALTEYSGSREELQKQYLEANYHIQKAQKLLEATPHPAGKMAYRLVKMSDTLNKLVEEKNSFAAERATQFMAKNLVRHLRDLWCANTATPFHAGGDDSGRNPRDFLIRCFHAAAKHYPQITWFEQVDFFIADELIKSIKR